MSDQPERTLCAAQTASGRPCKKFAQPGSAYCSVHRLQYETAGETPGNGRGSPEDISYSQTSELEYETGVTSEETPAAAEPVNEEALRAELSAKLDELIDRVQKITPVYKAPPFSPSRL